MKNLFIIVLLQFNAKSKRIQIFFTLTDFPCLNWIQWNIESSEKLVATIISPKIDFINALLYVLLSLNHLDILNGLYLQPDVEDFAASPLAPRQL